MNVYIATVVYTAPGLGDEPFQNRWSFTASNAHAAFESVNELIRANLPDNADAISVNLMEDTRYGRKAARQISRRHIR